MKFGIMQILDLILKVAILAALILIYTKMPRTVGGSVSATVWNTVDVSAEVWNTVDVNIENTPLNVEIDNEPLGVIVW